MSSFFLLLCTYNEDDPEMQNNYYTKNHLEFNKAALWLQIRQDFIVVTCNYSPDPNMGIRTYYGFVDLMIAYVLIGYRIGAFYYNIRYLYPDMFHVIYLTLTLNKRNWWRSQEEPFFASADLINSFVC